MRILGNTFKDDLNAFLKNNALWICIVLVAIIIATIVIIFVIKNRNKNSGGKFSSNGNEWIEALGGKENVTDVSAMGSRLSITLKDNNLIKREDLTNLGVSNIMMMSNKVTLIIEDKAEKIASVITKAINN